MDKNTRKPSTPGEILRELYLEPLHMTVTAFAEHIGVSRKAVSELINGHTSVSVEMAMRLSRAFSTSPDVWLNLQKNYDLWKIAQDEGSWENITPIEEKEEAQSVLSE